MGVRRCRHQGRGDLSVGSLEGTVALVTGAGQGVGRGVALAVAEAGAAVALLGRTRASLDLVAVEVRARSEVDVVTIVADVTVRAEVDAAIGVIERRWGRLDTVVNAAYDSRVGSLDELTAADAEWDWRSGLLSVVHVTQAAWSLLAAAKGSIVNVSAATGLKPDSTTFSLYASTKEAVRSLTRTAACELAADGIRVNAIIPLAPSPSFTAWAQANPDEYDAIVESIPLGYLGDPVDDVGPVAVFLASAEAHYLTGTTLMADGGRGYLR